MAASNDDEVPPLEDMSDLLQQIDKLKEHKESQNVTRNTPPSTDDHANKEQGSKQSANPTTERTFGGMKKGFLFNNSRGKSTTPSKELTREVCQSGDDIPMIKPTKTKENSLQLPEVQQTLNDGQTLLQNKGQWLSDDLLKKVASNPTLMKGMSNPHFMQAITEFQNNPSEAMNKYKDNAAVQNFMKEFTGIMGVHFTNIADEQDKNPSGKISSDEQRPSKTDTHNSNSSVNNMSEDERQMQKLLDNPDIKEILQDNRIQLLIHSLKTDTEKAQRLLSMGDADFQRKIKRLCDVGLLQFQR